MPIEPKNCVNNLLEFLAALNVKSAQIVLRNRNHLNDMAGALKELYSYDNIKDLVFAKSPFLAMVSKQDDFCGQCFPVKVGK